MNSLKAGVVNLHFIHSLQFGSFLALKM